MSSTFSSRLRRPAASTLPHVMRGGGISAGLGGGLAMMIVEGSVAGLFWDDRWLYPNVLAAVVDRPGASAQLNLGGGPLFLGLAIHFLLAALFGAIFDIVYHRMLRLTTDFGLPMYSGLAYGVWLWVANYYVVLPALGAGLPETYAAPFLLQHLIYGSTTGLLYIWLAPEPYHER